MPVAFTTGTSSRHQNTLQKGKFNIQVLLLLHVLIPGVMSSSLETINPWLSACDLKEQDPKGYCAATTEFPASTSPPPDTDLLCPKECSPTESKTNASCLAYLNETRRNAICNFNLGNGIEWLKSFLGTIRLRYCCEYKIIESLSSSLLERVLRGKDECFSIIDSLVEVDNLAARLTCEFSEVLNRYDCRQPYSVKFSCNDCLEAYRRWVCSTLVPYYNDSVRIRPCRSVCQAVEQKCPYFLPENRAPSLPTQYAGEPTFLCMDPNIPEVGQQQRKSLYPDDSTCCVKICGSLKNGLCVEKGSKCKSEELISYEEALDQIVDCSATDTMGTRVPNLECTASEPYSSPHKLGSGAPRPHLGSALLLLSACINHCFVRGPLCPLLLLSLCYLFSPLPTLYPLSLPFLSIVSFLTTLPLPLRLPLPFPLPLPLPTPHPRNLTQPSHLPFPLSRPSFVSNYLQLYSYKWQYYFILISVNLLSHPFTNNPRPLTTPPFLFEVFTSKETRRARRYYYYYYYYYYYRCKHYYRKLMRTAQKWKDFLNWKRFRAAKRGPFSLVEKKILFRIKNSLSMTRVKESRCINRGVSGGEGEREREGEGEGVGVRERGRCRRGRTRESGPAGAFAGAVGGSFARARVDGRRTQSADAVSASVGESEVNHVGRVCGVTSDPKCQFQTLS